MTKIEWVKNADGTQGRSLNPTVGCSKVSPGCAHCYAECMAMRLKAMGRPEYQDVVDERGWTGRVNLVPERLDVPMKAKKPTTWFVDSMSDLFHPQVPFSFVGRVYQAMYDAPQHTFLVLTKRPERMKKFFTDWVWSDLPSDDEVNRMHTPNDYERLCGHIWHGVSISTQKDVDEFIQPLIEIPGRRFVSFEPLLGPIDLDLFLPIDEDGNRLFNMAWSDYISGLIIGGESGPLARPMNLRWVRSLIKQAQIDEIPTFIKQLGAYWAKAALTDDMHTVYQHGDRKGSQTQFWPEGLRVQELAW